MDLLGGAPLLTSAYADVPGYPLVFLVIAVSIAYFALATGRHVRLFAHARASRPFDDVPGRTRGIVVYALAQRKMFKDRRAGVMHFAIFWGFVLLTVGTADILTDGLLAAVVSWPFDGTLWAAIALMQNVVAVVVLVAVFYASWRRLVTHPKRLTLSRGALIILGLIAGVVAAEVLAMTFGAAAHGDRPGALITNALASVARGLPEDFNRAAFDFFWWAHMALIAAFICYLPGSKHLHIVASFVNIYFRKLTPRGQLPAIDLEAEDQTFGVRTIADLGWKDLLDSFTCTECGRCTASCPANRTGKSLSPKELIMGIRHMAVEAERGTPLLPTFVGRRHRGDGNGEANAAGDAALAKPIVGEAISLQATWDCVMCGACVEACPVLIEHVDKIVGLRRNLVLEDSKFPPELATAFRNMETSGNPWGQPRSARLDWAKDLPFNIPTLKELAAAHQLDSVEVLYWVGCAAAFDERSKRIARAFATCLNAAGVRFAVLGPEESCTGDSARRAGNEYLFQMMAAGNIATLTRYGMDRRAIVTTCPHCLNTIGVEYRQLGANFDIVHHATYLHRLLRAGRLASGREPAREAVTLQDSCYLARYNDIVADPRDVLRSLPGLELREMAEHGRATFCCGAGGGRMWMEEKAGNRINEERARQAVATGAAAVVTECPFCMTMLRDGVAAVDAADVRVVDLAEVVAARLAVSPSSGADVPSPLPVGSGVTA